MTALDIFATSAAQGKAKIPDRVEGRDLIPFLTGQNKEAPHETLFWRQGRRAALRHQEWKIVRMGSRNKQAPQAPWQLFNLGNDPEEQTDLAGEHPKVLAELIELWESTNKEMKAPLF